MRIALLSQSVDNESGIGRIVLSLARQFQGAGHEVHGLVQRVGVAERPFVVQKVFSVPFSKGLNKLVYRFGAERALRGSDYDIIHAFGVGRFADVVSAQSCHRAGIAIMKEHRGSLVSKANWGVYDRVSLADERRLLTSPRTKKIIAVSSLVKNQILEYYRVDSERIEVVPNGVDLSLFARPRKEEDISESRSALGIPKGRFVLLFMGNEFGRKGLAVLIRSLATMRDSALHLLVVGRDDPVPYQHLAHAVGCLKQITFRGGAVNPERVYSWADAFVLPTLYEPFGMVIVEAMAAGLPVIATSHCGAVEGMKHGVHGLYLRNPGDVHELADQIRNLTLDGALRDRLAHAGREEARGFDWSLVVPRILDVYKSIMQQH